ncbi:MAG: MBL fold metallo-hydrolase [Alphaproteobacteria bacterium]|nr:MAG: MBL fold metallo-hydrolase [Alphaproteobacteria bacterium]
MLRFITLCLSLFLGLTVLSYGQNKYDKVEIKTIPVGDGIYMLQGAGGNIGISTGEDGVLMIDDQFSPLTQKILDAIAKISDKPVKFLINTHWHGDHTGGNENLGKMGVVIVAHDNVYRRMSKDQVIKAFNMKSPPAPKAALPVITFNDQVNFHFNAMEIHVHHIKNAHTDGDSILIFKDRNIIHTGDIFFNGFYPFIDSRTGGSIYGMIKATAIILKHSDDKTKIIPGHGPLANKQDLQNFHDMLVQVVEAVTPLAQKGLSLEEATKQDPLKDLNAKWGGGFFSPEKFLGTIYQTILDHK